MSGTVILFVAEQGKKTHIFTIEITDLITYWADILVYINFNFMVLENPNTH
jgi:hypothetical protein